LAPDPRGTPSIARKSAAFFGNHRIRIARRFQARDRLMFQLLRESWLQIGCRFSQQRKQLNSGLCFLTG